VTAAVAAAVLAATVAPSCFAGAGLRSSHIQPYGLVTRAGLAGDISAILTAPYRFVRLASITKEVAEEAKERAKSKKPSKEGAAKGSSSAATLKAFLPSYMRSHVIARTPPDEYKQHLRTTLTVILDSIMAEELYPFEPYHEAVRGPEIDHYAWGNAFFRSMVKFRNSRVLGKQNLDAIKKVLDAGENVVLFANHQTEADPQVISLLLEREGFEDVARECIFVAGHKVTTDRLAIPFSMGRNLLSIFSKKYLDEGTADEKQAKAARNQDTVGAMQRLMKEGGHTFWVAPSGGRDRKRTDTDKFAPAKFDQQSVGLFVLLAQKAAKGGAKTHFFPLAMWTHRLVPPPDDTVSKVGEARSAARASVGLNFGSEIDLEAVGGRKKFPGICEQAVNDLYDELDEKMTR